MDAGSAYRTKGLCDAEQPRGRGKGERVLRGLGCRCGTVDGGARGRGEGVAAYSILYYSTIVVYQSHTDRYSVFAIRGNHACRALLAQHQK